MAKTALIPKPPVDVAKVLDACPKPTRIYLNSLRAMIYETSATLPEAGTVTESLKWGNPSYAPVRPKSGTPIRLGWDEAGDTVSMFVHCQTSLIKEWREHYSDSLDFIGNRELRLTVASPPTNEILCHCIAMALTYHVRKKAQ